MTPLICPSPTILDQTFPRDNDQLSSIAIALGEIQSCIEEDKANLVLTETLRLFVEDFDWNRTDPFPLLTIIYNLLNQWTLQPTNRIVFLSTDNIHDFVPHPIPENTINSGYVSLWADEIGKLLVKHDDCCINNRFFIGIACDKAFAGLEKGNYCNPENSRAFPMIGPSDLGSLADAYEWEVPLNIKIARISFSDFIKNCRVIGATKIERPDGDSHYHIYFGNFRWQLSCNDDPIPDNYLKELVINIGLPLHVIKFALVEQELPKKVLRIQ